MSVDADTTTDLEAPAAVLDGLLIYDSHAVLFDHDRATCERDLLGLYATTDGQASIRLASDEAAQVSGLLAHSLVEPTERLRDLGAEARELLADRVADIGGIHQ